MSSVHPSSELLNKRVVSQTINLVIVSEVRVALEISWNLQIDPILCWLFYNTGWRKIPEDLLIGLNQESANTGQIRPSGCFCKCNFIATNHRYSFTYWQCLLLHYNDSLVRTQNLWLSSLKYTLSNPLHI